MRAGACRRAVLIYAIGCVPGSGLGACMDLDSVAVGGRPSALVYGEDGRREAFEVADPSERMLFEATAAFIPRAYLDSEGLQLAAAPTHRDKHRLCAGQRFGDQPAAAFCSAVLVDDDLVLTAGHCLRQFALSDFRVVFGYYYTSPGELAWRREDVRAPIAIVSEALDSPGTEPLFDHAWVRLDEPVSLPRRPVALHIAADAADTGEPVRYVGSIGGTPLKLADGAVVRDSRQAWLDYLVADTDTSHGASGGGAFAPDGALLGVLSRGGDDYRETAEGCLEEASEPADGVAHECYSRASTARTALCKVTEGTDSLCRPECGEPCRSLARAANGCAVGFDDPEQTARTPIWIVFGACVLALRERRRLAVGQRGRTPRECRQFAPTNAQVP